MQPLTGITVVSLEHAIAAPFATRQLADLGARVIKIERPQGGDFARGYDTRVRGLSSHFVWTNRSKQSLTLDLKQPQARDLLQRLIFEQAHVVVQNLAPGAAARLGVSYDALATHRPDLIVCNISGYGEDGPYRSKKAYDLLIQSEAGFLSVTGTEPTPSKAGPSIADIAAGMYAFTNVMAALMHRQQTGQGQSIDLSMLESLTEWMGYPMYYAFDDAPPPPRTGASHATIFPYGPFPVGDGTTVMLGLQNEREWKALCVEVLRQPMLAEDPRFDTNPKRSAARDLVTAEIVDAFSTLTQPQVLARLDQAGIANASVNDMRQLWAHPQLQARGRWHTIDSAVGPLPALRPPGSSHRGPPRMDAVPMLGQHTDAILTELGLDADAIAALRASQAI